MFDPYVAALKASRRMLPFQEPQAAAGADDRADDSYEL
jgi:hypothetical protein